MLFFVVILVFNQLFMGFLLWSLTYQHQVNSIKDHLYGDLLAIK